MVFDEERRAVDWIFRYANPALAKLEKLPLESLIDHSFGSLFANMDAKWLRSYERAVLYGEMLEIFDYSPEVDTYLKVTCFPTFAGHCGCILFNVQEFCCGTHADGQRKSNDNVPRRIFGTKPLKYLQNRLFAFNDRRPIFLCKQNITKCNNAYSSQTIALQRRKCYC